MENSSKNEFKDQINGEEDLKNISNNNNNNKETKNDFDDLDDDEFVESKSYNLFYLY